MKIMPRSGSALQEIAFSSVCAVVVAYKPSKAATEVLLHGSHTGELSPSQQTTSSTSDALPVRHAVVIGGVGVVPRSNPRAVV
ncbi:hypothetical protein PybrP1_011074 [[Pythium] brassicae (nom. inval.)]|nr:hypothetical protein PybrP1_011074 [[Pythium] brassicae (nom. inval.)]